MEQYEAWRILLQSGDSGVFHIAVHLELERAAQDRQCQQQNHSSRKKVPAEGCFHAYSTSNLYRTLRASICFSNIILPHLTSFSSGVNRK